MEILQSNDIGLAVQYLRQGKVIAHPTESVFGLGCDPENIDAVSRILQIKHRALDKGFILIASSWEQLEPLVTYLQPSQLTRVFATWPGPTTWLFPRVACSARRACGEKAKQASQKIIKAKPSLRAPDQHDTSE